MIFDSQDLFELKNKYKNKSRFDWPGILILDSDDRLSGEKVYLENLIRSVSNSKQKDWLGRLINSEWQQYIGAWFEMMLYGWLREIGDVQVDPEIENDRPDFSLRSYEKDLIIEARACLVNPEKREDDRRLSEVQDLLRGIELPFCVEIKHSKTDRAFNLPNFRSKVINWLSTDPGLNFNYQDEWNNHVILKWYKDYQPNVRHIVTMGPIDSRWINPEDLKPALREKSKQHKNIRAAGYPYVIAVYLESPFFTAEEVVEAWFGKEQFTIDINTRQILSRQLDMSGLHYWKNEVLHRSVSGTLVFRAPTISDKMMRSFDVKYVENPYATEKLDPALFPVSSAFLVTDQVESHYKMEWKDKIS